MKRYLLKYDNLYLQYSMGEYYLIGKSEITQFMFEIDVNAILDVSPIIVEKYPDRIKLDKTDFKIIEFEITEI